MQRLLVSPFEMHDKLLKLVEREAENARKGLPARIILKLNSLAERQVIEALYKASDAGVQIDLIVRGICCLRPGVKGLSENVTVRSIVDRFLEHSRVYYFENACQPQLFISSADWMQRNFFRRIEVAFPIEDGVLRERLIGEILAVSLADNTKARQLQENRTYIRVTPKRGEKAHRSQFEFIALASAEEETRRKRAGGKARFPQVKLATSPFATAKKRP
jgi:polyphosphate kinase